MKMTKSLLQEAQRTVSADSTLVLRDVLNGLVEADINRAQGVEVELTAAEGSDATLANLISGATELEDKLVAIYEHVLNIKTSSAAQVSGDVLNIVLQAVENSPYTTVQYNGNFYSVRGKGVNRKVRQLTPANRKSTLVEQKFRVTGILDAESIGVSQSFATGDAMMLQVNLIYQALGTRESITVLINVQNEAAQLGTILGFTKKDDHDPEQLIELFKEAAGKNPDQLWSIGVTGYPAGATYTIEGVVVAENGTFNAVPASLKFQHENEGIIADAVTLRRTRFDVGGENDKFAEYRKERAAIAKEAAALAMRQAASTKDDEIAMAAKTIVSMAQQVAATHYDSAVKALVSLVKD